MSVLIYLNKQLDINDTHVNADETGNPEFPDSQTSLEDLCRSHLVRVE